MNTGTLIFLLKDLLSEKIHKDMHSLSSKHLKHRGEEQYLSDLIYCVASFNGLLCGNLLRISALKFSLLQDEEVTNTKCTRTFGWECPYLRLFKNTNKVFKQEVSTGIVQYVFFNSN